MAYPKFSSFSFIFVACLILGAGIFLRWQNGQTRQFHADEAVQAYQTWKLLESGNYQYSPNDRHGPTLYYFSAWLNRAIGRNADSFDETSARLLSIVLSVPIIGIPLLWRKRLGNATALLAAALIAIAPLPVIYGAYFTQESLLVLFSLLFLYVFWRYTALPTQISSLALGTIAGLMVATKETALIHMAAIAIAVFAASVFANRNGFPLDRRKPKLRDLLARAPMAALTFLFVWLAFYSSFFTHWNGLRDSVLAYFNMFERSQGTEHDKDFFYYVSIFTPHSSGGIRWGHGLLVTFIVIGFFIGELGHKLNAKLAVVRLFGLSGSLLLLIYSLIPYKTPWLALTPFTLLSVTGAIGMTKTFQYVPKHRVLKTLIVMIVVTAFLEVGMRTYRINGRYASDDRNPYIYSHTVSSYQKLEERLDSLLDLPLEEPLSIAIYSPDHAWPLPWDLRKHPSVGYFDTIEQLKLWDVVIIDARLGANVATGLNNEYISEIHGLRPNTPLICHIRLDLWETLMATL